MESCLLQMLKVSRVSERRSRGPQGSNASLLLMDRREGSSRGASARAKGSEQQKTASTSGWGSCSGWLRAVVWQKGQLLGLGLDALVSAASEDAPALALVNAAPLDLPGSLLIEGVCAGSGLAPPLLLHPIFAHGLPQEGGTCLSDCPLGPQKPWLLGLESLLLGVSSSLNQGGLVQSVILFYFFQHPAANTGRLVVLLLGGHLLEASVLCNPIYTWR